MTLRLLLLALLSAAVACAVEVAPLFNATFTLGEKHYFVLVSAEGKVSSWLTLGDSFAGYRIKGYLVKERAIDVEKDGKITRVALEGEAPVKPLEVATPAENRGILTTLASKLPASGTIKLPDGKWQIVMGKRMLKVGSKLTVTYQGADYELELAGVDATTFTLKFRGEEVAWPLKPKQ